MGEDASDPMIAFSVRTEVQCITVKSGVQSVTD